MEILREGTIQVLEDGSIEVLHFSVLGTMEELRQLAAERVVEAAMRIIFTQIAQNNRVRES